MPTTIGGYTIENFRPLAQPFKRGNLPPLISCGEVSSPTGIQTVYWDEFGYCANHLNMWEFNLNMHTLPHARGHDTLELLCFYKHFSFENSIEEARKIMPATWERRMIETKQWLYTNKIVCGK